MCPVRKGVKTPEFSFLDGIPVLKDGASDICYLANNGSSYPDIHVGDKNSEIIGIHAKLVMTE